MPKRNRVGAHAKLRAPFLGNRLGHTDDTGFRDAIVDLARVAVRAGRAGNLHDAAGLAVLDAEVGGRLAHEPEGRRIVHVEDRLELRVAHPVDHAVPRVARVVDEDVDLAVAEVGGRLDELGEVRGVGHVAGDGDGAVRVGVVDGFCDCVTFCCKVRRDMSVIFSGCLFVGKN